MKRTDAREYAFILVFEKTINDLLADEVLENAEDCEYVQIDEFVKNEFYGVFANIDEIDNLIKENCSGWSIDRVSRVSLAAMRLCCYEMLYVEDIPVSVSINETVELTKKYAGTDDSSYVNGVLGSISRKLS